MRDGLLIGATAGVVASLVQQVVEWPLLAAGVTRVTCIHLCARVVFSPHLPTNPLALLPGLLGHLALGAFFGVGFVQLLRIFGTDYYLAKGLGYGVLIWIVVYGFALNLVLPRTLVSPTLLTSLSIFASHLVFGAVLALVAVKYGVVTTKR